ncbi:hypothetical protein [Roseiflexus sp.]
MDSLLKDHQGDGSTIGVNPSTGMQRRPQAADSEKLIILRLVVTIQEDAAMKGRCEQR